VPRPAWLAAGAALGALALEAVPAVAIALFACALLAGSAAMLASGRAGPARRTAALALGVLVVGARGAAGQGSLPASTALPGGDGPWVGVVQGVGAPRDGSRPAVIQLETEPPTLVAATLPWFPVVVPGDRVALRGRIRPPPEDDYGTYLARIGAAGTLRADRLDLLPDEGSIAGSLEGLRRAASDGLARAMPEPEAGLATGVLVGLRDRVDRQLAADFTTAGASHVVAISGWNIAIVASTLAAFAGGLRRRRRAILTAVAIVVYVAFVGPSPSVVRAGVMAGIALLARELGRPGSAAAALGWAVTGLLLLDPAWVGDAGFRLSVLATAGILAWGTSLTARIAGSAPGRPRRWIAEILGVSLAAQAATTPIVLLDFGRLSLVAPLVNLVVVPLVPPAMAAGALALVVGMLAAAGLPALIATLVGLPAWAIYAAMVTTVRVGAGLPLASLELEPPWDIVAAGVALALIVAAARFGERGLSRLRSLRERPRPAAPISPRAGPRSGRARPAGARVAAFALAGSTIGLGLVLAHRPDGVARIVMFDVGQGDAILVESGQGGRMVVDGGPDPQGLLTALDERLPPWDHRIDLLVMTHPHEDHDAGLVAVLGRYRVGRAFESGMAGSGPGYQAWQAFFASGGPPRATLATGDVVTLDELRFRVLWPDRGTVPARAPPDGKDVNNTSIVLLGENGTWRFLLMGDLEEDLDPVLVGRGLPRVDVLKVAHHGSRTATTPAFLEAVRPSIALISVGADNDYGHPSPDTLARLDERGIATYRTDRNGTIEVALGASAITVRAERNDARPRTSSVGTPAGPGASGGRRYHPPDAGTGPLVEREPGRRGAPRLLLGRRRLRPRGGRRGHAQGPGPLPRRPAGALATGGRTHRSRPPPRRDPGAARDRLLVRRRQPRDPARGGRPDPQQRPAGAARGRDRRAGARQRPRDRRGNGVRGEGPAEQTLVRSDQGGRRRGPTLRCTAPGRARGVDRAAGTGAPDQARGRGRARAGDARRRLRPRGRRRASAAGPRGGHGAREARPPPRSR
jgi:competence protein ComEC